MHGGGGASACADGWGGASDAAGAAGADAAGGGSGAGADEDGADGVAAGVGGDAPHAMGIDGPSRLTTSRTTPRRWDMGCSFADPSFIGATFTSAPSG